MSKTVFTLGSLSFSLNAVLRYIYVLSSARFYPHFHKEVMTVHIKMNARTVIDNQAELHEHD